jgi:hypothetical protein
MLGEKGGCAGGDLRGGADGILLHLVLGDAQCLQVADIAGPRNKDDNDQNQGKKDPEVKGLEEFPQFIPVAKSDHRLWLVPSFRCPGEQGLEIAALELVEIAPLKSREDTFVGLTACAVPLNHYRQSPGKDLGH